MIKMPEEMFMNHRFSVFIGPEIKGSFAKVSGIENEIELETYREGGENMLEYTFPRMMTYQRLVLERGIMKLEPLWVWYCTVKTGIITKLPGTIILHGPQMQIQKVWAFNDAYPVKYVGPSLDALNSEIAILRLEFVHGGIEEINV